MTQAFQRTCLQHTSAAHVYVTKTLKTFAFHVYCLLLIKCNTYTTQISTFNKNRKNQPRPPRIIEFFFLFSFRIMVMGINDLVTAVSLHKYYPSVQHLLQQKMATYCKAFFLRCQLGRFVVTVVILYIVISYRSCCVF